jgi:hypothetical protein
MLWVVDPDLDWSPINAVLLRSRGKKKKIRKFVYPQLFTAHIGILPIPVLTYLFFNFE